MCRMQRTWLTLSCVLLTVAFGDIHSAIISNDLEGVRTAVANGELNKRSDSRQSPVMHSTLLGRPAVVDLLLESGADLSITDAKPGNSNGYTPIHGAGFRGRPEIMRSLIKAGMDPNDIHNDGFSPLHRACWGKEEGHTETIEVLLEVCGEKCATTKGGDGDSPLQMAADTKNTRSVEVLTKFLKERNLPHTVITKKKQPSTPNSDELDGVLGSDEFKNTIIMLVKEFGLEDKELMTTVLPMMLKDILEFHGGPEILKDLPKMREEMRTWLKHKLKEAEKDSNKDDQRSNSEL